MTRLVSLLEGPASRRLAALIGFIQILCCLFPIRASAQSVDNLVLVINDSSPASVQVGEYYAQKRKVASDHVVHINTVVSDTVARAEYLRAIEAPIGTWLSTRGLQDTVLYLVLAKGVPLRIAGTDGLTGTVASVDSELTLLYQKLLGNQVPLAGRVANPYFLGQRPIAEARSFTRFTADTYLVTRLDGFSVDDVKKLIDRSTAPSTEGSIVLDEKATGIDRGGDSWLQETADRLKQAGAGDRTTLETTRAIASVAGPVLGYYSWGSNDPANQLRHLGLQFANGAIGGTFVSTDGRTFNEPPADWKPSDPNGRGSRFGGSFQSLTGDLIREGITGVSGHVAEPYLDATIRPQILFPAYLAGFNLAESFYLAMPFLSWQTIIVGDPLCRPFPHRILPDDELHKGLDAETDLPALFAERRLAILSRGGLNPEAVKLSLKADVQVSKGNQSEAEKLWARATDLEPRLTAAQLQLAVSFEARGAYEEAADRYRRVIAESPQNVAALNNLAYLLAERQHLPKEALPIAQRALRISDDPSIADTLAWVYHLLGDDRSAAPIVERAAAGASESAEIQLHAAFIHAGVGDLVRARRELDAAEKLDPQLTRRSDVKALRQDLSKGPEPAQK
jgi:uncharacterized protein (TIGR03790 family)